MHIKRADNSASQKAELSASQKSFRASQLLLNSVGSKLYNGGATDYGSSDQ